MSLIYENPVESEVDLSMSTY